MPTEVLRCNECNAPLKAVPSWMATAKVKFTCNSCPKRSARAAAARFDTPLETPAPIISDPELQIDDTPDADDEIEMDTPLEDIDDDAKDDKEIE